MRFYFHIANQQAAVEDPEGMELPSFVSALEEGTKIIRELLDDPDTATFEGGVMNITGSNGLAFISLPIALDAAEEILN